MRAVRAGTKSRDPKKFKLDGCPDPATDLLAARLWVAEHVFGVTLRGWQLRLFEMFGHAERPRVGYVQIGRKNGKTWVVALFVLTELILLPDRHLYGVSDSERNLRSVLWREIETLIYNANVQDSLHIYMSSLENPHNGSFFELRPSNFQASQGVNPHAVFMDEVHLQKDGRLFAGMQMSCAARTDGLLLGVTTPGYDVESLAHDLYLQVKAGELAGLIYEPSDPNGDYRDVALWREANPCAAEDPRFLEIMAEDLKLLPESEFRRFRLGQWTSTEKAWLPYGAWDARMVPASLNLGDRVWLGFDGSHSGDSTALVACGETGHLTVLNVWEKPQTRSNLPWRVPRAEVMDAVDRAFADFDVQMMHGDPPYWNREFQEWDEKYPNRVLEFPWASPARSGPACSAFYAAVMDGLLSHDGDTRMAKHVANAVSRPTPHGVVIEKWNKDSPRRIDLAVSAVMAYYGLATGLKQARNVQVW